MLLEEVSASLGKKEIYDFAVIAGNWTRIVGQAMAHVSTPVRLSRKTLSLEVREPVWADSMGYMKKQIIENVNRLLGKAAVSKIGMSVKKAGKELGRSGASPIDISKIPQSAAREAEEAVKFIDDSQLRSTFKRVILKDIGHKYSLDNEKLKP